MKKLQFKRTHRVLIKSTETGYDYNVITIDVNNGTYMKDKISSKTSKIRVNKGLVAEKLCYNGLNDYNIGLTQDEALAIADKFNSKRVELGFEAIKFWRLNEGNVQEV
jgi:phage tail sheath protein FI